MATKSPPKRQKPVALVVDDEPLVLLDTSALLTDAGYEVVEAHNAHQALAVIENDPLFSLLVTDIQMPGSMDGIALACQVGQRWPDIRIAVLSGAVTPLPGVLPARAQFITKPIDHRVFAHILREFET